MVTPEPAKRPRASYRRFRYPDPNGCWQLDGFEYRLDDDAGSKRCVLQVEDDHSRFILASHVARAETSEAAIAVVAEGGVGRPGSFRSTRHPEVTRHESSQTPDGGRTR